MKLARAVGTLEGRFGSQKAVETVISEDHGQ
jgi:hypothetical protein